MSEAHTNTAAPARDAVVSGLVAIIANLLFQMDQADGIVDPNKEDTAWQEALEEAEKVVEAEAAGPEALASFFSNVAGTATDFGDGSAS